MVTENSYIKTKTMRTWQLLNFFRKFGKLDKLKFNGNDFEHNLNF